MTEHWGRIETAGTWPRPKPVWTLALLLIAILSGATIQAYRYATDWTPLQRVYLLVVPPERVRRRARVQDGSLPFVVCDRSQGQSLGAG